MHTAGPMRDKTASRRNPYGFSLIELLVVVAILTLLIGILVPSLGQARVQAKRTKCMANLKDIGRGILAYLNVNNDTFFFAAEVPSKEAQVAEIQNRAPYPPIYEALQVELGGEGPVFQCPADRNTKSPDLGGATYVETEKTSYEWRSQFNGKKAGRDDLSHSQGLGLGVADAPMMYDFESFHGGEEASNSLVTLYADLHVDMGDWRPTQE